MTKIKGTEEHVLFHSFAKVICKEDGSPDDQNRGAEEKELLHMIIQRIRPPLFLCKCSFAKRPILQIAKIKGMEEHGSLQMTIWMIRLPLCSFVPLQMVICK